MRVCGKEVGFTHLCSYKEGWTWFLALRPLNAQRSADGRL